MANKHTFHIPVMGVGFTLDSAIKVAPYGIDSVLSLCGQSLFEKLRKHYSKENNIPYVEISDKLEDYKAKQITAFLNLTNNLVTKKIDNYIEATADYQEEIEKYLGFQPDSERLKSEFHEIMDDAANVDKRKAWVRENIKPGSIDVNIMTKLDRENFKKREKLLVEHNDAHTALRGYALSDLSSSLVLSAGLNPKLYTYMQQFKDFYPDINGEIKKKIILKVSDFRSAYVQGKFLAKRGLWVSEYRIESGLNCGGHAFATEGYLMGPILEEFKQKKNELFEAVFEELEKVPQRKDVIISKNKLSLRITAQGGVGTSEEHNFLRSLYNIDSIGWGSPFLLVPEVTSVDDETMLTIIQAKEEDFYLSKISPLGVPFNSLRGTTKELETKRRIEMGKPGSPCIEGNLALFNTEFSEQPLCTASREYQKNKLKQLSESHLDPETYKRKYDEIVEKTCICTGLSNSIRIVNDVKVPKGNEGVSICPGPNMYYFKKIRTLQEMADHIYGRKEISFNENRPHMFIKELKAYLEFLAELVRESSLPLTSKSQKRLLNFSDNLFDGINYYKKIFAQNSNAFKNSIQFVIDDLNSSTLRLKEIHGQIVLNSSIIE